MKLFAPHVTDFYKTGHIKQYPPCTEMVYSNFTARSAKYAKLTLPDNDDHVVFFGLQAVCQWLLSDLWNDSFFKRPKEEVIAKYKRRMDSSLGEGAVPTTHMEKLHDLGYLPLLIKALPEGSLVPTKIPLFTVRNTHKDFGWVTNYIETQLSAEMWRHITSATIGREFRYLLDRWASATGSPPAFVPFQGHDFSARGLGGIHAAAASGAAHLISFMGTDTIHGIDYFEDYYGGSIGQVNKLLNQTVFIGGSVPATEHSVMCLGGRDTEIATFRRIINEIYPKGIVSIVSDTWDFFRVITEFASELKDEILAREPDALGFAKVVFRPDSGDPVKIICGDPKGKTEAERKGAVECLWDIFGGFTTSTGHRVLDSHVGLIYGDSITYTICDEILDGLNAKGFASCNMVFGIGSYTYQNVTRDTFGHAYKTTYGVVNGEGHAVMKEPKTDDGLKKSASGLIRVEHDPKFNFFDLHENQDWVQEGQGALQKCWQDGVLTRYQTIDNVRKIALQ